MELPATTEHLKKFAKWTELTRFLLVGEMGFLPDRVIVLANEKTTQADIKETFAKLKDQVKPGDSFFLFLIGHGSYDGKEYKFNNVGPDLTGTDFSKLLSTLPARRIVVVNSTMTAAAPPKPWREKIG